MLPVMILSLVDPISLFRLKHILTGSLNMWSGCLSVLPVRPIGCILAIECTSGFILAIYMDTMEKSEEKKGKSRISSLEAFDTRPVNGKSVSNALSSRGVELDQAEPDRPGSLMEWFSLAVYWTRELIWRRRFWSKQKRNQE